MNRVKEELARIAHTHKVSSEASTALEKLVYSLLKENKQILNTLTSIIKEKETYKRETVVSETTISILRIENESLCQKLRNSDHRLSSLETNLVTQRKQLEKYQKTISDLLVQGTQAFRSGKYLVTFRECE